MLTGYTKVYYEKRARRFNTCHFGRKKHKKMFISGAATIMAPAFIAMQINLSHTLSLEIKAFARNA